MQSFQIVLTVLVLFVAAAFCSEQEVTQQDAQKTTDKLKLQELLMLLNPKLDGDDLDGSIYQNGQQPGLGESDEEMGKLGDEDDQDDQDSKYDEKRSGGGAYLRFGKRNPAYLRFGRSNPYLRFGKRLPNGNPAFLRFGKRNPAYLRFGK